MGICWILDCVCFGFLFVYETQHWLFFKAFQVGCSFIDKFINMLEKFHYVIGCNNLVCFFQKMIIYFIFIVVFFTNLSGCGNLQASIFTSKSRVISNKFFENVFEAATSVFILICVSFNHLLIVSMNCKSTKWYLNLLKIAKN